MNLSDTKFLTSAGPCLKQTIQPVTCLLPKPFPAPGSLPPQNLNIRTISFQNQSTPYTQV